MRQHFSLDRLSEYGEGDILEETRVVNPEYRRLDGKVRRKVAMLSRKLARFGSITIDGEIEPKKIKSYEKQKTELQEEIATDQKEVEKLKSERKSTPKHIQVSELPKEEKLQRLKFQSKDFLDTIKMIAYRAETAMVNILRESMSREDDARSFVRSLYQTTGDI